MVREGVLVKEGLRGVVVLGVRFFPSRLARLPGRHAVSEDVGLLVLRRVLPVLCVGDVALREEGVSQGLLQAAEVIQTF